jgi:hypothetical protein
MFSSQLRGGVNAERAWAIGLDIRSGPVTSKNEVSRQVRQCDVPLRTSSGQDSCSRSVHAKCCLGLRLAEIDRLKHGAVEDGHGSLLVQHSHNRGGVADVGVPPRGGMYVTPFGGPQKRRTNQAGATENDDCPLVVHSRLLVVRST